MKKTTIKKKLSTKYKQTAITNPKERKRYTKCADKKVLSKKVGWRKSKSGKLYFESRKNRSDVRKRRKL